MMPITRIHLGKLGRYYKGRRPGLVFALLPEPVDADACLTAAGFTGFADSDDRWDEDFGTLIAATLAALRERFGEAEVIASERAPPAAWIERLDGFLFGLLRGRARPGRLGWTPSDALQHAARDDRHLAFAYVGFGGHRAGVFASDGHPVLWIWLDDEVVGAWSAIEGELVGAWPASELALAWESLLPAMPLLARELPRVALHRGDSASWTDGSRTLGFQAGLGVDPAQVYLPPESAWSAHAPSWAATLRPMIVADFEAVGVRVVEVADAAVWDR